jgi:hypothetical protein
MQATRSTHRLLTWILFAILVVAGLGLEKLAHEMHLSKLLILAGIGVWARELPKPQRWAWVALVGLLWLMILVPWYQYRNQHLVPIGKGAWRIENK